MVDPFVGFENFHVVVKKLQILKGMISEGYYYEPQRYSYLNEIKFGHKLL